MSLRIEPATSSRGPSSSKAPSSSRVRPRRSLCKLGPRIHRRHILTHPEVRPRVLHHGPLDVGARVIAAASSSSTAPAPGASVTLDPSVTSTPASAAATSAEAPAGHGGRGRVATGRGRVAPYGRWGQTAAAALSSHTRSDLRRWRGRRRERPGMKPLRRRLIKPLLRLSSLQDPIVDLPRPRVRRGRDAFGRGEEEEGGEGGEARG